MAYDSDAPAPTDTPTDAMSVQAAVRQAAEEAWQYVEGELVPKWKEAIDYYFGRPFGNEEDGRSKVVSTDVRDSIQATLPGLLRIFCGSEQAMAARPRGPEDTKKADEQTAYANLVFFVDNEGFRISYDAFVNALREGVGVLKVWWEDEPRVEVTEMTGLSAEDLVALEIDPYVELSGVIERPAPEGVEATYDATVTRVEPDGRIRVDVVPPEEFLVSRAARNLDDGPVVGHRREMRAGDLLSLGYTWAEIEPHIGPADTANEMEQARTGSLNTDDDAGTQPALRPVLYSELWMWLALEIEASAPRLFKLCAIGEDYKILRIEPANEVPFAVLVPLPEPHAVIGQAWSDLTKDIQRIKSAVSRGQLDSLALALHPRRVVLDGQVDIDDVFNTEMGAVIRERVQNATRIEEHRFVGADAFPMLEYQDAVKEDRTGQNRTTQGLNAESMQSMTRLAGSAMLTAAHQRVEMLARIFAERDGFKRLFRLIIKLARRHQTRERVIRLRGEYIPVDPRNWDTDLDFEVTVGLGTGLTEERRAALNEILMQQTQLLTTLGPTNPVTSMGRLRNTLAKLTHLAGYPDEDEFWKPVDDAAIDAAMAEEQKKAPEPTPEQVLAQAQLEIERMKTEKDVALRGAELELRRQELELEKMKLLMEQQDKTADNQRANEQMVLDYQLKVAELEAKYAFEMDVHRQRVDAEGERLRMELAAKAQEMGIAMDKADHELAIKRAELALKGAEVAPTPREQKLAQAKEPPAPKRRKVQFTRDASGRVAGADITEE